MQGMLGSGIHTHSERLGHHARIEAGGCGRKFLRNMRIDGSGVLLFCFFSILFIGCPQPFFVFFIVLVLNSPVVLFFCSFLRYHCVRLFFVFFNILNFPVFLLFFYLILLFFCFYLRVSDLPAGPSRFIQVEERFEELYLAKASEKASAE